MGEVVEVVLVALLIAMPFAIGLYAKSKWRGFALTLAISTGSYVIFRSDVAADDAGSIAGLTSLFAVGVWVFARAIRGQYLKGKRRTLPKTALTASPSNEKNVSTPAESE